MFKEALERAVPYGRQHRWPADGLEGIPLESYARGGAALDIEVVGPRSASS